MHCTFFCIRANNRQLDAVKHSDYLLLLLLLTVRIASLPRLRRLQAATTLRNDRQTDKQTKQPTKQPFDTVHTFYVVVFLQTTTDKATTATTTEIYASNNKALPTIAIITPIQQRQKPVILAIVIGRYREESRERECAGELERSREVCKTAQLNKTTNAVGMENYPKHLKVATQTAATLTTAVIAPSSSPIP